MALKVFPVDSDAEKALCFSIRHVVFVDEQNVPVELEIDEFDATKAHHFLGYIDNEPVAAARICIFDGVAKIQRVAVLSKCRGKGVGRDLMVFLMNYIRKEGLARIMALDSQTHARRFYNALGFVTEGDEFDDAGIPHIYMKHVV